METEDKYSKYDRIGDGNVNWQEKCLKEIENEDNVILSSPTGSGKTKVFLEWALKKKERPIFITAPIKALSNQRYRELVDEGYTVGIETGDVKNVPENCEFICCTQEIYTNKYAKIENATLIVDEFHYIFENPSRARTYIDALHNSKAKNILLCSATLGDVNKLKDYADKVSGRDFMCYENDSRLTSLFFKGDIEPKDIKDSLIVTFSRKNINNIVYDLWELRDDQDDEKIDQISALARQDKIDNYKILEDAKKGIAGYYGGLLPKEKLFIEKCFEQGLIDSVVGTDALALGVNFPVQNVIFAQLAKYYEGPISKNLFDQLAGRAGRKGYFDEGYTYYCSEFARYAESYEYSTERLYDRLLDAPNEDLSIKLSANIKDILLGNTTIEDEAEFIANFSTESVDKDEVFEEIARTIDYIKNDAFDQQIDRIIDDHLRYSYDDYYDDEYYDEYDDDYDNEYDDEHENAKEAERQELRIELEEKRAEFDKNIARVYFDEYSPYQNCAIFTDIICGVNPDIILSKYASQDRFYDMLQFRKYVKSLPKKYRKGLTKISDSINEIDDTVLNVYRGKVSVQEIGRELDKEGRLNASNISHTLSKQANFKNNGAGLDNPESIGLEEHE